MRSVIICFSLVITSLVLSSCSGAREIRQDLRAMSGKDINLAISQLGPADTVTQTPDMKVYIWETGSSQNYPEEFDHAGPDPGYGSDVADDRVFGSHPGMGCAIKLVADQDGIIRSWDFKQGLGSCSKFRSRLR